MHQGLTDLAAKRLVPPASKHCLCCIGACVYTLYICTYLHPADEISQQAFFHPLFTLSGNIATNDYVHLESAERETGNAVVLP